MKKTTLLFLILISIMRLANGQNNDMPPKAISYKQLPLNLEGYTVNIQENGRLKLYDAYSNEPAKNIYNQGGIRLEISSLEYIQNIKPGESFDINRFRESLKERSATLIKGGVYKLKVKIDLGGTFDNGRRTPTNLQGPVSQVVIHLPSGVKLASDPIVEINGVTQSQQMVSNLISIAALAVPGGALAAQGGTQVTRGLINTLKSGIIKALDKAASDFLISSLYLNYKPSEKVEISESINFGGSTNLQQITWVLGGHKKRDISTAKQAELTLYLQFVEEGEFDLSFFFNVWATHTYVPTSAITMTLTDIILHSFRQHVVLNMEVNDNTQQEMSGTFTDTRDGKAYKTVKIGNQVWMAENLAYRPGSGNYWAYDNNSSNVAKYGYLYDWQTVKNVCPPGWHLPSDAEWTTLTNHLGGEYIAGTKMKSTVGWVANGNGTNASGFSALPGGYRGTNGNYGSLGYYGYWWSSTEYSAAYAWFRDLGNDNGNVTRGSINKDIGFSVRCVRDN